MEKLTREVRQLNQQLQDLRDAIERNYAPRSEQVAQRRRFLLVLATMLLLLAAGGYVTERITLSHEHRMVASCFLQPTPSSQAGLGRCDREFPGYRQTREQSQATLRAFAELQRRVDRLEADQGK